LTLLHLLTITGNYFREKGIASARLDAELLLCHCLGLDRVGLYLDYDRPLLEHEVRAYRELVRRRAAHEPVAYITGCRDFWILTLHISRGVLIPRPETEVLVERALEFLAARDNGHSRVLDIGTGSGAIALSLASEMPRLDIVALDASAQAAACARANAERLGLGVRVEQGRFPEACTQRSSCYDLIVSNPPYIAGTDIALLAPDIRQYEPPEALDGGPDGLAAYREWIPHCARLLVPGGALMLEIGHDQGPAVTGLLADCGHFTGIEVACDYGRLERVVMCRRAV
jgi:release factor glutamine methyltransferase